MGMVPHIGWLTVIGCGFAWLIIKDPEASSNDRFVALELLKNANIASGSPVRRENQAGHNLVVVVVVT